MTAEATFWLTVLSQVQKFFILVGVVIFMTMPKLGKQQYLELGIILWLSLLTELTTLIVIRVFHTNPNAYGNVYAMIELPLVVLLYRRFVGWKNKNAISLLIIMPFVLFGLFNILKNGIHHINSYTLFLASICVIIISIAYFYVLIQELPTESITKLPMFWINTAFLIYHSGNFFLYLSADYLITVLDHSLINPWMFHNFLGLIFYAILWYAMFLIRAENLKTRDNIPI